MEKNKSPIHVFAIAAVTADGFIAKTKDQVSTDWTSKEDKKWFWDRTVEAGAVVMGSTTFFATGKPGWPLPGRMNYVLTGDTKKILDRYKDDEEREKIKAKIEAGGNLKFLTASPEEVIRKAVAEGYLELAVSGGTSVYTSFLPLIQTLYLTRETSVEFGEGLPLFAGLDLQGLNEMLEGEFELISSKQANDQDMVGQSTVFEEWRRK